MGLRQIKVRRRRNLDDHPGLLDPDNDGLTNDDEAELGTDPNSADIDGEGYTDSEEVEAGTDPLNPESYPGSDDPVDPADPTGDGKGNAVKQPSDDDSDDETVYGPKVHTGGSVESAGLFSWIKGLFKRQDIPPSGSTDRPLMDNP